MMRGDQGSLEHHMPQSTAAACNGPLPANPVFQRLDQAVEPSHQVGIETVKHLGCAKLLMRPDLSQQTFPHFDDLDPMIAV
ncbi:hypothetical protein [Paracoccus liaowanqingii]|uniref:hypothetical protein n=1 Tax=Paracoccus liaowanqingii TaxID=2560053 RepID=UPI001F0D9FAD|nr:hypothetical protein [Paracoccus liaowanqingii]